MKWSALDFSSTLLRPVFLRRLMFASICNGCDMPVGNAYPSGHLAPSSNFGTCFCSTCWDQIPRACHVFTRLCTSNSLGTFSNVLWISNISLHFSPIFTYLATSRMWIYNILGRCGMLTLDAVLLHAKSIPLEFRTIPLYSNHNFRILVAYLLKLCFIFLLIYFHCFNTF